MAALGGDLRPRVVSGVVMIAAALLVTGVGGFPFALFWLLAAAGVVWEWQRLIGPGRIWLRTAIGVVALAAATPWAVVGEGAVAALVLLAGAVAVGGFAAASRVAAGGGVLYGGAAMLAPVLLRASPSLGLAAVVWLYAVVWGTDIAAFFGGRALRGPKLWPAVSPGKTWSGAIVGAIAAAVLGLLVAAIFLRGDARPGPLLALGVVTSALSQAGDLFESALKRRAGVKDSSRLIPGHGGLMDRLDGFIVAAAFAAAVAWLRSTGPWIAPGLLLW